MTRKEIALATIERRPAPRHAAGLLSGGCWTINRAGFTLEEMLSRPEDLGELVVKTSREALSDLVWLGSGYHNLAIRALGGEIKFRKRGAPDVKSTLLEKPEDIEKLDIEKSLRADAGIVSLTKAHALTHKAIGHERLVGSSQWGAFTLTGHLLGVERVMRAMIRKPEEVNKVLSFGSDLAASYLELFAEAGAEILSIAEPTASGDLISRDQFKNFALPWIQKTVARLKRNTKAKIVVHICGNIANRLDLLAESGADLLSVDYKVDLAEVRAKVGGKMAFSGNLNPVAVMQNGTPEQVKEAARKAFARAGAEPGYMFMPGCDIPPATPLENINALVSVAEEFANG